MRLLIDTSILIGLLDPTLHAVDTTILGAITDPHARVHASVASLWEIAIKVRLRKLALGIPLDSDSKHHRPYRADAHRDQSPPRSGGCGAGTGDARSFRSSAAGAEPGREFAPRYDRSCAGRTSAGVAAGLIITIRRLRAATSPSCRLRFGGRPPITLSAPVRPFLRRGRARHCFGAVISCLRHGQRAQRTSPRRGRSEAKHRALARLTKRARC